MRSGIRKGKWRTWTIFTAVCLAVFLFPLLAQADTKTWNTGSGDWNSSYAWWFFGQPEGGDRVYLTSDAPTDTVVAFKTDYPSATYDYLRIDQTGGGTMILLQGYAEGISLSTKYVDIGYGGKGSYQQSFGTHTVTGTSGLALGINSGSTGTYYLSGNASLSAVNQYAGLGGTGYFIQLHNTTNNVSSNLFLGHGATGRGFYTLDNGTLSAANQYIGNAGSGTFTQNGGNNTVRSGGKLIVGNTSASGGTYNLNSGDLRAPEEQVGVSGTGKFNHFGGRNEVNGDLKLGVNSTGSGSYDLAGSGYLSAANVFVGYDGSGAFSQISGTNRTANTLYIAANPGSSGSYILQGGTLIAGTIQLNPGGTFWQQGGSLNPTTFNQQGGTVKGNLENQGTFNYTSGTFSGRLLNYGTVNFNADFTAGDGLDNYANLTLGAGRSVTLNGHGLYNQGTIFQNGGSLTVNGLGLGQGLYNQGTITQSGGSLTANGSGLINRNTLNLTTGPSTVNGQVINEATGQVNISDNSTLFTGRVINFGTVKTTSASVTWAGGFTNSGGYFSDQAVNSFTDLTINSTGYITGGVGDLFQVSNDFKNQSMSNLWWNTLQADLVFTAGGDNLHDLYLPGKDLGPGRSGFDRNFAWGKLDLTGQSLILSDGNDQAGGALYVGKILGVTLDDLLVMNIFGNGLLNIYYDPDLNADLQGLTYDLSGGGRLIPIGSPVPLPASAWLFLSGLAGLGLLGRKRFRSG